MACALLEPAAALPFCNSVPSLLPTLLAIFTPFRVPYLCLLMASNLSRVVRRTALRWL